MQYIYNVNDTLKIENWNYLAKDMYAYLKKSDNYTSS